LPDDLIKKKAADPGVDGLFHVLRDGRLELRRQAELVVAAKDVVGADPGSAPRRLGVEDIAHHEPCPHASQAQAAVFHQIIQVVGDRHVVKELRLHGQGIAGLIGEVVVEARLAGPVGGPAETPGRATVFGVQLPLVLGVTQFPLVAVQVKAQTGDRGRLMVDMIDVQVEVYPARIIVEPGGSPGLPGAADSRGRP